MIKWVNAANVTYQILEMTNYIHSRIEAIDRMLEIESRKMGESGSISQENQCKISIKVLLGRRHELNQILFKMSKPQIPLKHIKYVN